MMRSEAHGLLGSTRLSVFGRPAIEHRGTTVPLVNERRSQLLAYLAIDGGWVERDRLAALLWPDHDTAVARRNLRKIVFRAREMDWTAALESQGECLRWTVDSDLFDFRAALAAGQPDAACAVYGGRLLEGLDDARNTAFQAWLDAQRAGLHRQWRDAALRAMPRLANAALRAAAARRLVDDDPLDEPTLLAALAVLTADGNATQAQGLLRDYLRRLTEEIGRPPSAAVLAAARTVVEPLSAAAATLDAPATIRPIADHQRRAGDAFVGRRSERRELLALLGEPDCRVVTVLGPGGIGKSRFAREQLPELLALTQSDVLWVALEDLATAAQLLLRIAQALGTPVSDAGDVVAQIVAQRGEKATLLVLDNAEHLPELADWLQPLLAAWPRLRLLLTSRARVGLAGERLLPLGGLAIPDAESRDLEAAVAFDAVRLFELRARRARPGFDLAAHLDAVVALLERVDGMPLAIEWAADWVRLLPPGEIVRELDRSIDILQRDPTSGDASAAATSVCRPSFTARGSFWPSPSDGRSRRSRCFAVASGAKPPAAWPARPGRCWPRWSTAACSRSMPRVASACTPWWRPGRRAWFLKVNVRHWHSATPSSSPPGLPRSCASTAAPPACWAWRCRPKSPTANAPGKRPWPPSAAICCRPCARRCCALRRRKAAGAKSAPRWPRRWPATARCRPTRSCAWSCCSTFRPCTIAWATWVASKPWHVLPSRWPASSASRARCPEPWAPSASRCRTAANSTPPCCCNRKPWHWRVDPATASSSQRCCTTPPWFTSRAARCRSATACSRRPWR
jgi:DNA-binding SARP family transcriptional activator